MRIPTLEYSANQPMTYQIAVPTNSEYAVGVKVAKDGQTAEYKADIAINTHDGFSTKFSLQVQQKDMGYFELLDDEGGDIIITKAN